MLADRHLIHFDTFARSLDQRSRLVEAAMVRQCAADPCALGLLPSNPTWDAPHRLMAAVQMLILQGVVSDYRRQPESWRAFRDILESHGQWIAAFIRQRTVQTNEPLRCFALLPIFLTIARTIPKPLDLLELGPSGGLNLFWDQYQYCYRQGSWGNRTVELMLTGEEADGATVPADLLRQPVEVLRRRGIDLDPVDLRSPDGVRYLESFLLGDEVRIERLRRAAAVVRKNPPELVRGDYLERLPELLTQSKGDALTVIFQTISTIYLAVDRRSLLSEIVADAGRKMPLAWISTPTPEEHGEQRGDYPLELTIWPDGEKRTIARMSNSGSWLQWLG